MAEQQQVIEYRLEIIGGPWDGLRGLAWLDDGEPGHGVPERIWIGKCTGKGSCSSDCIGEPHPSYWTAREDVPVRTVEYEKETDFVERHEDGFTGVARYAIGGLGLLPTESIEEIVPAGATALAWEGDRANAIPLHFDCPLVFVPLEGLRV